MPGSPIRTPWDHSSVDSSPRPIAASHVLHRLLMPRHPPYALKNLTTKALKMLASTVQFSTNTKPTPLYQEKPPPKPARSSSGCGSRLNQPSRHRADCLRTQQDACMFCEPHLRPFHSTHVAVLDHWKPLSANLRQCLRHMSTPPPHSGSAGSLHPFG